MEGQDKRGVSFLVFGGFIVLFLLFLFLSPKDSAKGAFTFEGVVGSAELGGFPIVTLVIVFVILIIVLVAVILLLKKFRRKKHNFIAPKPEPSNAAGFSKSFNPLMENAGPNAKSGNIGDEDIENLFSENVDFKKAEPENEMAEDNIPEKDVNEKSGVPTPSMGFSAQGVAGDKNAISPSMVNMNQLKMQINSMFKKGYNKDQIVNFLESKGGFTSDQVSAVIGEINKDNLKNYISSAMKQGFSREQIARNLMSHGWRSEQISKFMK